MANFPQIRPLDLPNAIQPNPIDFRPLGEIGNTIADYRRKQQIADVLAGATDARGNLDVEKAGALLSKIGALDEARPMLALAQQKAALAQHGGQASASLAEQTRHNQASEDLARRAFEEGKTSVHAVPNMNTGGTDFVTVRNGVPTLQTLQTPPPQPGSTEPIAPRPVPTESYGAGTPLTQLGTPQAPPAAAVPAPISTAPAGQAQPQYNEAAIKDLSPSRQALVKGLVSGDINPNSISARGQGGGDRAFLVGKATEYANAPGMDPYDQTFYGGKQRTLNAFNAGTEGKTVRAVNNLVDHIETAKTLFKALENGDVQLYNSIKNKFQEQFGYPAPTNVQAAAPIIGGEITKVVAGIGGGGVGEREQNALSVLSTSKAPGQAVGALDTISGLMAPQIQNLERQYKAGTKNTDFRKRYLSPEAIGVLERKEGIGQPSTFGQTKIPGDAVRMLQNDKSPSARANFDAAFGPGASDRILGPQR
jgi:hypothetical protein